MKTIFLTIFFTLSLSAQRQLTILHWNDFHTQNLSYQVKAKSRITNTDTSYMVGGSATLAAYLKKYHNGDSVTLLLNAGDDFQGSPISTITKGRSQIQLMNLLKPDAFTLGNHEFDYGRESLVDILKEASFPVVSANLIDTKTGKPFAGTYIIKQFGKVTVAVIGLMTTELPTLSIPSNVKNLDVKPLAETVNELVPQLKKEGADIIVALTHQGVSEDSMLAVHAPDLDIIVGGHSHTPLFRPKRVNGILIVQAGSRGRWIGKIDLTIDADRDTILNSFAELIECRTADLTPDSIVAATVNELEQLADKSLNEVIGVLHSDWKRTGNSESNIGNWISDAMRSYTKSDIAFQNSDCIRKDALAGDIKVRDIWEISPFGNTLVTFTVSGAVLRSMLRHQLSLNDDFCQVSGMTYVYVVRGEEKVIHNVKVNGKLLNDKAQYSVVTNNYVAAQSKKYFGVELDEKQVKQLHVIDRDVLIEAVKKQKVIRSVVEGRIKEAEE